MSNFFAQTEALMNGKSENEVKVELMKAGKSEDEIKKLRMITLTINDTVPRYDFNPSRNEFKEFIDNNGFSSSERFVKINKK